MKWLVEFVRFEGNFWSLWTFVLAGLATLLLDSREMETKEYRREARLARVFGALLIAFGFVFYATASVLKMIG